MKSKRLFYIIPAFLVVYMFITWKKWDFNSGMNESSEISFEDATSSLNELDVSLNLDVETNIPDETDVTNDGNSSKNLNGEKNGSSVLRGKQVDDVYFTMIEKRNKMRLARAAEVCKTHWRAQSTNSKPIMRAFMDPNHRIAYCRVSKVASTYTLGLLERIFNVSYEQLRKIATDLYQLPYSKTRNIFSNSYNFLFVREPYGRLFSTYSNKFYFTKPFWAPIGPEIVKRYRIKPSMDSLRYGHNITFKELIRYIVEEHEAGRVLDTHIRPMNIKCNPCEYRYNFIGKLETMTADWTYLKHVLSRMKRVNIPEEAGTKIEDFHEISHVKTTFAVIRDSTISKYKLYLRVWSYFQITGRIYKYINMPFEENSVINEKDFMREVEAAAEKSKLYAEETKRQKTEALKQAYASVPLGLLERLSKVVALDCMLYGYDNKPDWIFNRKSENSDFNYFKGLA